MARLKLGSIVTRVSGKLGAQTLYSSNGTAVIKNNIAKSGVKSRSQQKIRQNTAYFMQMWSTISEDAKARWYDETFNYTRHDKFGDKRKFNAFQLFQRINQFSKIVGMDFSEYPTLFHIPSLPVRSVVEVSESVMSLQNNSYTSNDYIIVYATKNLPKGITNAKRYYRQIAVIPGSDLLAGVDIMSNYLEVFQPLQNGNQISFAYKSVSAISGYSNNVLVPQSLPVIVGGVVPPPYDSDAQAFIDAVGTLTVGEEVVINNLVLELKSYSLWSLMSAIYPIIGGTASAHKFNLKNPLDTNAAFRLNFVNNGGSWVHSSTGAKPSGGAYADTFFNATSNLLQNDNHISFYSRDGYAEDGHPIGVGNASNVNAIYIVPRWSNGQDFSKNCMTPSSNRSYISALALLINTRRSSTQFHLSNNATITNVTANSTGLASGNIWVGSSNSTPFRASTRECAFASIGLGLSNQNLIDLNTIILNYQTALGRNV